MKIVAISDLHGYLPKNIPEGDTLCICGDIFPLEIQNNLNKCDRWLNNIFIPWSNELPYKNIILIAGNHDFFFENIDLLDTILMFEKTKINFLEDSWIQIENIKFYGTPWCHKFGNWAYMVSDDELKDLFEDIPEDIDFLLTHDAPYGVSDICEEDIYWNNHNHIGNIPLREAIIKKKPKFVLHGHLHSSNHNEEILEESKVYNVSLLNESYNLFYEPLIIEYDPDK